jgi:plastocyanin
MMRWLRLVGAVFALFLLFTACSDDSGDDAGGDDTASTDDGGGGCDANVCLEGLAFAPEDVSVAVGETVTWANVDGTDHTVTSDDDTFDSGTLPDGDTFEQTFDEAGAFTYHCAIHSSMTGTVTVE